MVSFADVSRQIACPWLSPYDCPSGIVLDVKSKLIRKEYIVPLLWYPTAMFTGPMQPRFDVRWGQRNTNNRWSCEQSSFTQSPRYSLARYGPFLQQQRPATPAVALLMSSGVWHQVGNVCRCDDFPASRLTSSTGVLFPLVMVPQPMDDTTMRIQLSGNSRLCSTSLQHTNSPPTHLVVEIVSSTHAFRFSYLGFRGTIAACELKHRSGKPLFKVFGVTSGLRFMLILVAYLHSAMQPLPHM
ncbi:hypothetical protein AVEN_117800-1 [Araneus ventricosus]|uniref:Uncharacterized protein n=1 Tax=Araneus ventricosus TaxID=182803 RepID=A0A4Y2B8W7_ARAVE|nr:hypothetical protein AVEN_117800-1 [Araneus ventricosus]